MRSSIMGKSNMNIFDWIFSNNILLEPQAYYGLSQNDLRDISPKFIDRRFIHNALGWSKNMYNQSWKDPKKILHSLRPLMTCLYYLEKRKYQPNIQIITSDKSMEKYRNLIFQLVELKKVGTNTNNVILQSSLDAYEELKELIQEKEQVLPEHLHRDEDIRKIISYIRLNTLNQRKKQTLERPTILS